jgi:hypothetical protein
MIIYKLDKSYSKVSTNVSNGNVDSNILTVYLQRLFLFLQSAEVFLPQTSLHNTYPSILVLQVLSEISNFIQL